MAAYKLAAAALWRIRVRVRFRVQLQSPFGSLVAPTNKPSHMIRISYMI